VLRGVVKARWDLPGFDNSAMDGYALRAADIRSADQANPVSLPVRGEAAAGRRVAPLEPASAMRILTGSALPAGADTVVRQEDTVREGAAVLITRPAAVGTNVRHRGEDVTTGSVLLQPGARLTPADIAAAAAAGMGAVSVGRVPRVAVLATGDELRPAGADLGVAQVADSNSPMISAAVREAGAAPLQLGIVADDYRALRDACAHAAESSDLIVSSAGVSVGDHDHVQDVLADLGEIWLWRVAMRPGMPLLLGRVANVPFVGLPGNPVSSSVTFELFARPAILRLQGARQVHRPRLRVRVGEDMAKPRGLDTFPRARMVQSDPDELPLAVPSGGQGSHMLGTLVAADVLLVLPAETALVARGSVVDAIPLR
jgi:molybdopterin molybdotransferase